MSLGRRYRNRTYTNCQSLWRRYRNRAYTNTGNAFSNGYTAKYN